MNNSVHEIPKAELASFVTYTKSITTGGTISSRTFNPFCAVLMLTYTPNFWSNLNKTSLYMVIISIRLVYLDKVKVGMVDIKRLPQG